jgi:hypothetical protein
MSRAREYGMNRRGILGTALALSVSLALGGTAFAEDALAKAKATGVL